MNNKQEMQDNENYSKNFTRVPNIVFVSYKHLSKEEKFLYCTLRQVYWDMKPRFASTREISELTGYSRGALAKMLPRLHACGLIHAEIRREKGKEGREKGNAKYHITIPDIWELNRKYFACTAEERAKMDPSLKLAHETDSNSCSPNGQACSPNDPSLLTKKAKPGTFGERDRTQVELAKDSIKDTSKDPLKERGSNSQSQQSKIPSPSLSPEIIVILDWWDEIRGEKIPRSDKQKKAAKELADIDATKERIQAVEQFCLQDNPEWYAIHGIDLQSISNNWSKWKSVQGKSKPTAKHQKQEQPKLVIDQEVNEKRKAALRAQFAN